MLAACGVFAALAVAGPIQPASQRFDGEKKIVAPKGNPGVAVIGPIEFRGGKRACVIAQGDKDPSTDVGIKIYDAKDRLVAQDMGKGDQAAVVWYPPADGKYTIHFINPQPNVANLLYVVIK